jgi:hypothetical protein
MSRTVSQGLDTGPQVQDPLDAYRKRGRGRWVAAGVVVVLVAAGAVYGWRAGVLTRHPSAPAAQQGAPAPAAAAVTRQNISQTTPVSAVLGYDGSYSVTGKVSGTLTWLPSQGQVIRQGQVLYRHDDGAPVVLLYGSVPDWRALSEGKTGQDVAQLNHDLVALGYARSGDFTMLGWDYYSWETAWCVQELETRAGVTSPPGTLALGQVVFEPEALRVSQVTGTLGGSAAGPVLAATSDRHVVTVALGASQQSEVAKGDKVTVTLPNGTITPGTVTSVGTVATTATGSDGTGSTTIPVQVRLSDPKAAGTLDQAPVTVNVTTATARDVLAVPVGALVAQAPGGYSVEVIGAAGARDWVPVTPGIFDDSDGLVQVTGALTPGQRVVVPSS